MNRFKKVISDDSGNSVIESTVVVTIVIIMLFVFMLISFFRYQQILIQSIADDVSTSISRTYGYSGKDPVTGYYNERKYYDKLFGQVSGFSTHHVVGSLKSNSSSDNNVNEALVMADGKLNSSSLINPKASSLKIEVTNQNSKVVGFSSEIVVNIEADYYIPLVRFFGIKNSVIKAKAQSIAFCPNMIQYYSCINTFEDIMDEDELIKMVQYIITGIKSVIETGFNIQEFLK